MGPLKHMCKSVGRKVVRTGCRDGKQKVAVSVSNTSKAQATLRQPAEEAACNSVRLIDNVVDTNG